MKDKKNEFRAVFIRRRNRLSASILDEKSKAVAQHLLQWHAVYNAPRIFAYRHHRSEVRTLLILKSLLDAGKKIYLPKTNTKKRTLEFYPVESIHHGLIKGAYGVYEPRKNASRNTHPRRGDVILVPGVSFDRRGYRLGYGKGYYDSFLKSMPRSAVSVGLCFEAFLVPDLPKESHDARVPFVATEKGVFKTSIKRTRQSYAGRKKHRRRAA